MKRVFKHGYLLEMLDEIERRALDLAPCKGGPPLDNLDLMLRWTVPDLAGLVREMFIEIERLEREAEGKQK